MSNSGAISRAEAEEFLYHEAELLDDWRLQEWKDLYADDSRYEVTSTDCEDPLSADPAKALFLVADKKDRIDGRANRLLKSKAHAEYPLSKVRHLYTNVRVVGHEEGVTKVRANFLVLRSGYDREQTTQYMGEFHYSLIREGDAIRIRSKRGVLDLNSLYNQGQMAIIL